jgi:hypothetical protein
LTRLFRAIGVLGWTPALAYALGTVGLESSSFLYSSDERASSAIAISASLDGEFESSILHGRADLLGFSFTTNRQSFTLESHEAYIATSRSLADEHEFTIGRRLFRWNHVDQVWSQMSLWTPRFNWDPIYPERIGLTGAFYRFQDKNVTFLLYGSPLSIPERGTPLFEQDGTIVSSSPFFKPLPTQIEVLGVQTDIRYQLINPSLRSILLRPNAAARMEYRDDSGLWASASVGVLPVHMPQLAAEPFLNSNAEVQVNIRTQFPLRNLSTFEAGLKDDEDTWGLWISASRERPFRFSNDPAWINPVLNPSEIYSGGAHALITKDIRISGALLYINERAMGQSSALPNVNIDLPSRFPIKRAFQAKLEYAPTWRTDGSISWMRDILQKNNLVSLNISHRVPKSAITFGGGVDLTIVNTTKDFIGQYFADDRLRGWLRYAF